MKATFKEQENGHSGNISANRKENHFKRSYTGLAIYKGKIVKIVDLRIYATQARTYACLWVHSRKENIDTSGGGKSSEWGYDRISDATQKAIIDSGFSLSENIAGRGDGVFEEAITAIMNTMKYKGIKVIESYA